MAFAGARGIATLNHKIFDHTVERCPVVVALETQLHEIAARLRCFLRRQRGSGEGVRNEAQQWTCLGPELDVEGSSRRVQDDLATSASGRRVGLENNYCVTRGRLARRRGRHRVGARHCEGKGAQWI
jgi:hypothetical protein